MNSNFVNRSVLGDSWKCGGTLTLRTGGGVDVNFSQPGRQVSNYRKRLAERRLGLNKLLKTRIGFLMSCTSGGSVSRKQRHGQQPSWMIPNELGRPGGDLPWVGVCQ